MFVLSPTLTDDLRINDDDDRERFEANLKKLNNGTIQLKTFLQRARKMLYLLPVTWPKFLSMLPNEDAVMLAAKMPRSITGVPDSRLLRLLMEEMPRLFTEFLPYTSLLLLARTSKHNLATLQPYTLRAVEKARAMYAQFVWTERSEFAMTIYDRDGNAMEMQRTSDGSTAIKFGAQTYVALDSSMDGPRLVRQKVPYTPPYTIAQDVLGFDLNKLFSLAGTVEQIWFRKCNPVGQAQVNLEITIYVVWPDFLREHKLYDPNESSYMWFTLNFAPGWRY